MPSGFSSNVWGNAGGKTTPYLINLAQSGSVSEPVLLGSETGPNPTPYYLIMNMAQLQAMSSNLSGNYVLGTNLTDTNSSGSGFSPIGSNSNRFTGNFNGLGHTITDLYINRGSIHQVGLFGFVGSNSFVGNIGLVGVKVTGGAYNVGGLTGVNTGTISNAYATGSVTGSSNVGGLVGENFGGTIRNAYATGSVTGSSNVGGLAGSNTGTISNAYATGSVGGSSSSEVGGLVGDNFGGTISNAYATGSVTGSSYIGGLAGSNSGLISNAYATGSVTGSSTVGGLVGRNSNGTISNAYWDTSTMSKVANAVGNNSYGTTNNVAGMTTAKLASSLPSGFTSNVWGDAGGKTTPYLLNHAQYDTTGPVLLASETGTTPPIYNVILNMAQLQAMGKHLNRNYVLAKDLTDTNQSGAGFSPIGAGSKDFKGTFDGLGHTISNLYIDDNKDTSVGLFSVVSTNGVVKNITLKGGNITTSTASNGSNYVNVGELAGSNIGTISNAHASGTINVSDNGSSNGAVFAGGLVGFNETGTISNSYATGTITATGSASNNSNYIGGLAGGNAGNLNNTHTTEDITVNTSNATDMVGGLAGRNESTGSGTHAVISQSHATGSISVSNSHGSNDVGGLTGSNYGTISQSYATGKISVSGSEGSNSVGGFAGKNTNSNGDGLISNSYATGNVHVTGSYSWNAVGGFVGNNSGGVVTNAYATGRTSAIGTNSSNNVGGFAGNDTTNYNYTTSNNGGGVISKSYALGNVKVEANSNSSNWIGGFVGTVNSYNAPSGSLTLDQDFSTGDINVGEKNAGTNSVGGFAGYNGNGGEIRNSYTIGNIDVSGSAQRNSIGGVVGQNYSTNTKTPILSSVYAYNSISNTSKANTEYLGGIVGLNHGATIADAYWDKTTAGTTSSAGKVSNSQSINSRIKAEALDNAQMLQKSNFKGFSFSNPTVWYIKNGRTSPYLLFAIGVQLSYFPKYEKPSSPGVAIAERTFDLGQTRSTNEGTSPLLNPKQAYSLHDNDDVPQKTRLEVKLNGSKSLEMVCSGEVTLNPFFPASIMGLCHHT